MLMPIRWPEPFGMVMIEAMACGTPVIAFPEGAAPEIVVDGVSGFLVEDESEMAAAIERLPQIDPMRCRASVADRFDIGVVAGAYERAYRTVIGAEIPPAPTPLRSERRDPGLAAVRPQPL
jgi:glycosyltransferase involved in cell wall biosynthesis